MSAAPHEIMPGLVVRGTLAAMRPVLTVVNDGPWVTMTLEVSVPHVGDGRVGPVALEKRYLRGQSTPRETALRLLERMWMHEWYEAIELDGHVIGNPH